MAQQERPQLLTRLQPRLDSVLTRSAQIAHRLVRLVRHPDGLELARARQLGQSSAVATIVLDAIARAPRDQRRGHDFAVVAVPTQLPIQAIARGPGLVDDADLP